MLLYCSDRVFFDDNEVSTVFAPRLLGLRFKIINNVPKLLVELEELTSRRTCACCLQLCLKRDFGADAFL